MRIDILTLFPEMFEAVLRSSIIGKAEKNKLIALNFHNIRDYTQDKHKRVDDYPYGGGLGMVMQCEPIYDCVEHVTKSIGEKPYTILLTPQGKTFKQQKAKELLKHENIILICGHYEGIDERVVEGLVDEEISIGDYVLTGGEIAAMAVVDATCRLIPGVLREEASHSVESFNNGLLEFPQYTRPAIYRDMKVPEVLQSGHHKNIENWRRYQSLKRTIDKRPDLIQTANLLENDIKMLEDIKKMDK